MKTPKEIVGHTTQMWFAEHWHWLMGIEQRGALGVLENSFVEAIQAERDKCKLLESVADAARKCLYCFDNDFGESIFGQALPDLKVALQAIDELGEKK